VGLSIMVNLAAVPLNFFRVSKAFCLASVSALRNRNLPSSLEDEMRNVTDFTATGLELISLWTF